MTQLLQQSLAGSDRILLIATIDPAADGATQVTLDFAKEFSRLRRPPPPGPLPAESGSSTPARAARVAANGAKAVPGGNGGGGGAAGGAAAAAAGTPPRAVLRALHSGVPRGIQQQQRATGVGMGLLPRTPASTQRPTTAAAAGERASHAASA